MDDMAEIEQNFNIVKIDLNEIEEEGALIDEQIREEEKRYITADVNQRLKLEKYQVEHEEMRQLRETLQQQLKIRNERE